MGLAHVTLVLYVMSFLKWAWREKPVFKISDQAFTYKSFFMLISAAEHERGMCIKGLKWPPSEQKTEICFSQISLDSFIRRMAEV